MPVTTTFQQLGHWSLRFKADAPPSIVNAANEWDHVAILPVRAPIGSAATAKSLARYVGRVDDLDRGGQREIGGPGVGVWLGDHAGKGSFTAPEYDPINSTLAALLNLLFGTASRVNGLTLGSTTGLSSNLIQERLDDHEAVGTAFGRWAKLTDVQSEWAVNPDGSVDWQKFGDSYVFRQTPQVLISLGSGGLAGGVVGFHATELRHRKSVAEYATDVTVTNTVGYSSTASTIFTRPKAFDGATDAYIQKHLRVVSADTTDTDNAAENELLSTYTTKWTFNCQVDVVDPGRWLMAGDYVWVYDVLQELYDLTRQVPWGGSIVYPALLRCYGLTWGLTPGMGVLLLHTADGSNTVEDITDWVDFSSEPEESTLQIGTAPWVLLRAIGIN